MNIHIPPFELDLDLWEELYSRSNKKYQKKKLLFIRYQYEGKDKDEILNLIGCSRKTLRTWNNIFLKGGLKELVEPIRKNRARKKFNHIKELSKIIIDYHPSHYGIESDRWTVKTIEKLIFLRWEIILNRSTLHLIINKLKEKSNLLKIRLGVRLDIDLWKELYFYNQEENLRKKMWAIRYFDQGRSKDEILKFLGCRPETLAKWLEEFDIFGLEGMLSAVNETLTNDDKRKIIEVLKNKKIVNYILSSRHLRARIMHISVSEFGVKLTTSQMCEIIEELEKIRDE